MQNRYVGDIGDYGKYGLLRELENSGYKLGISWYLVPDESHNEDGKHISYLYNGQYKQYDSSLFDALLYLVKNNKRNLQEIEQFGIFKNAIFYSEVLRMSSTSSADRAIERLNWHNKALYTLKSCPVIFLDPDNGLEVKSNSSTSAKGNKYVANSELIDYFSLGHTVILYQHRGRESDNTCLKKLHKIKSEYMPDAKMFSLKYSKGTIRHFVFFAQPSYAYKLAEECLSIAEVKWKGFYEFINVEKLII